VKACLKNRHERNNRRLEFRGYAVFDGLPPEGGTPDLSFQTGAEIAFLTFLANKASYAALGSGRCTRSGPEQKNTITD